VASLGLNLEEQKAVDRFRKAVVEPSMTKLVVLDFWAEWCGPCKALTPVLEKVCGEYADKGVVLAKVNVNEEQFIAAQFRCARFPPSMPCSGPAGGRPHARAQRIAAAPDARSDARAPPHPGPVMNLRRISPRFSPWVKKCSPGGDGERAVGVLPRSPKSRPIAPLPSPA
jgi:putative thioredoxin